jgi:hypothetical protein
VMPRGKVREWGYRHWLAIAAQVTARGVVLRKEMIFVKPHAAGGCAVAAQLPATREQ